MKRSLPVISLSLLLLGASLLTSCSEANTTTPSGDHQHSYTETVTKEATCTEKGEKTLTCSCGDSRTEEIAALGHNEVVDAATTSCFKDGKTEGSHCSVCNTVLKEQTTIVAPGHQFENGSCTVCSAKISDLLSGKTALFVGDSIVMASNPEMEHRWWGWAGRLNELYGFKKYKNAGVDGASISDCRKTNTVINQLLTNKSTRYDFVVLEGGTNDGWDTAPLGKMSDVAPEDVTSETFKASLNTFCGGLEQTLYYAKKFYSNATFVYVITPKMNHGAGKLNNMREYVDATIEICNKWGIPYINFYDMDASFYGTSMPTYFSTYVPDGVHPNDAGYDKITPYIAEAMAKYRKP